MPEISSTSPSEEYSDTQPEIENNKPVIVRAPRSPIWDWFLTFSTFGFYTSFWFYARTKELNLISKSTLTPWLWWLMPFFVIAQIFSFSRLNKVLNSLEESDSAKKNRMRYSIGSIGFILATLYYSVSSQWATEGWQDFMCMLIFSFSFTLISARINNIKQQLNYVEFKGKKNGYSLLEWGIVIIMFPLVFGAFSYLSLSPFLINKLETYPDQFTYTQEAENFTLTFHGEEWYRVEKGTYSDGTSMAEFSNSLPDSYFLLFNNDDIDDVNEHINFRREWIKESLPNAQCTEKRSFIARSMNLKVEMKCQGTSLLEPTIAFVTFIQTPTKNYELLGILSAPINTYRQWVNAYQTMAREFSTQ